MKKFLLSLLMVMLAVPALAFEIPMDDGMSLKMYGQVRMNAVYDYKNTSNGRTNNIQSDFKMNWQGNSRFGINFSAGNFFANAELQVFPDQISNKVGFRQFYGGYTFENGLTLLAGNKTTIAGTKISNTVYYTDGGLAGFGAADDTRRPMIMLSYAGLDFAIVANGPDHTAVAGAVSTAEEYLPRFEVAYNLNFGNFSGKIAAAYGLYSQKYEDPAQRIKQTAIHAFHVGLTAKQKFASSMYLAGSAFFSMNGGMYGAVKDLNPTGLNGTGSLTPSLTLNNSGEAEVNDVMTWGVSVAFGMGITDMIGLEIGGGYQSSTSDAFVDAAGDESALGGYGVYVQAPIKFAEGYFVITPEIGYFGRHTDATVRGGTSAEELIAGAQVKVVF